MRKYELQRSHSGKVFGPSPDSPPEKEMIRVDREDLNNKARGKLSNNVALFQLLSDVPGATKRPALARHTSLNTRPTQPTRQRSFGVSDSEEEPQECNTAPMDKEEEEEKALPVKQRNKQQRGKLTRHSSFRSFHSIDSIGLKKSNIYTTSQPISLIELLRKKKDRGSKLRSCLKDNNKMLKMSLSTHFEGVQQPVKSVRFATNAFNDRVWSLVRSVSCERGSKQHLLWWTEEEMREIRSKLIDLASSLPEYGEQLKIAFESCGLSQHYDDESARPCNDAVEGENPDDGFVPDWFAFNMDASMRYSVARGLEATINPVLDDYKAAHRKIILGTQERLKKERKPLRRRKFGTGGKGNMKASHQYYAAEWDLLREKSLERSRPCRLMAASLAKSDRKQAEAVFSEPSDRVAKDSTPRVPRRRRSRRNLVDE